MAAYDYASGGFPTSPVTNDTLAINGTSYIYNGSAWEVVGGTGEGTAILSTGETGGTKYLREDGDGTSSWQAVAGGGIGSFIDTSIAISSDGTALANDDGTANDNIAIGVGASNTNTSGDQHVSIGYYANGSTTGTRQRNVAVGYFAGRHGDAHQQIAIGYKALEGTSGSTSFSFNNVAIGVQAAQNITGGDNNIALGAYALKGSATSKLTGSYNSGIGYQAGDSLTTGSYNVLNGYQAGYSLTSGIDNVFLGRNAGRLATSGHYNIALGYNSMSNVALTGQFNTAFGYQSGNGITSGSNNVCIGNGAGRFTSTGGNNVLIGAGAGLTSNQNNKLHIANSNAESLIEGDFSAKTLKVNGTLSSTGKTYITKTAAYTAIAGDLIMADTATTAAFTITLPTSPTSGDVVKIHDVKGNFATANLTVARGVTSQEPINGIAEDFVCDVDYQNVELLFTNATDGWRIL